MTASNASQTSSGSHSTSSCGQENTATQETTTHQHRSDYATSSSERKPNNTTRLTHTSASSKHVTTSPSPSQNRKTESRENALDTKRAGTQQRVQFDVSSIAWRTFDITAPPKIFHSQATATTDNGERSKARTLPNKLGSALRVLGRRWAYTPPKSRLAHYVQAEPWHSSSEESTATSSNSSEDGEATKCSATSTSQRDRSHTTTRASCLAQAKTNSWLPHPGLLHNTRGHNQGKQCGWEKLNSKLLVYPTRTYNLITLAH